MSTTIERTAGFIRALRSFAADDVMRPLGLQRIPPFGMRVVPIAGAFCAGVVIGGGVALILAPTSGAELRRKLLDRAREVNAALSEKLHPAAGSNGSGDAQVDEGIRSEASPSPPPV